MSLNERPAAVLKESLQQWCGREFSCSCGETHRIPTRYAVVERGALTKLGWALRQCAEPGAVVCVSDDNTYQAAGPAAEEVLRSDGWTVTEVRLPADCHANQGALEMVEEALKGATAGVAIGAGTINDLTKLASSALGLPYVAVATAPSMNGFTSRVGAILVDGVKRTLPATPPVAVVADVDILCRAPADMIAAGLADLQARRCAASGWRMASLLRNEYFCRLPFEMMRETEALCQDQAETLRRADPEGVGTLTAGLLLSGFSMVIAGSSAPVSGGEHLLSHFWDMTRLATGKPTLLHGLQVGIGTLLATTLHQRLRDWNPHTLDLRERAAHYPSWDEESGSIRSVYGELTSAVLEEYANKYRPWEQQRQWLTRIVDRWQEVLDHLSPMVPDRDRIRTTLERAGAPTTIAALGLSQEEAMNALLWARCLRARYTVLDLAWDLGLLQQWADGLLEESGVA